MKLKVKCRPLLSAARGGPPPSPPLATPLTVTIPAGINRTVSLMVVEVPEFPLRKYAAEHPRRSPASDIV